MAKKEEKGKEKEKEKERNQAGELVPENESVSPEKNLNGQQDESAGGEEAPIKMILLPEEEVDFLRKNLEEVRKEAADNLENWKRERADFMNYKRRVERDQDQARLQIKGEIIKRFLPVLDDIERAIKVLPKEGEQASWSEGIDLIYRKLQNILEVEGVVKIPAEVELFDPTRHEAISYEPSPDHESGQVIEVIQQGYMLGDRVLRPALVRVAQ
jgi:molecular chaperone GrpE